jgi:indolepyruvate ferredoxin oxidoreductase beta subunit
MDYDIYLVGVGGQGVLTIAELVAEAAGIFGLPVNYYPTEGMAQRGGFVKAQVRIGRKVIGPNIPEGGADLVIAMEVSEALKALRFIRKGADFFLCGQIWAPAAVMLGKASYPDNEQVLVKIRDQAKLFYLDAANLQDLVLKNLSENLFALGAVVQNTGLGKVLPVDIFQKAIAQRWIKDSLRNQQSFLEGMAVEISPVQQR